jgi:vacuolar-type H+-ATPase subunit I/STV1
MTKDSFKHLLTDLYSYYNPEYIQYVDDLVSKYHRMEHSAVEMIIMKYNHRNSPYFDEAKSTEAYMLSLIKDYDQGRRVLEGLTPQVTRKEKEEVVRKDYVEENAQKITQAVDEKIQEVKSGIEKREEELNDIISKYTASLNELDKKLEDQKPVSHFEAVDIKVNLFYTESEIKLPNKEILASLGIGSRILVLNAENKPIGLEVKDITYDCVSNVMIGGKPTLEITLERG